MLTIEESKGKKWKLPFKKSIQKSNVSILEWKKLKAQKIDYIAIKVI